LANLETVYELKDAVDIIVASEEHNGWNPLVVPKICKLFNNNPTLSNVEMGNEIINIVGESEEKISSFIYPRSTMSAIRTDKLDELLLNVNQLSQVLIENINTSFDQIRCAFKDTLVFWIFMDFLDFIKKLYNQSGLHEDIRESLRNTWNCLNETIINNYHSSSFPNAHGMTINPLSMGSYYYSARLNAMINLIYGCKKVHDRYGIGLNFYHESGLDFINDSEWDEFLKVYDNCNVRVDDDGTKDYTSIQDAIDNASDYDVIYVNDGVYYENIVITKPIILIGDFQGKSIINGQGKGDVITVNSDEVRIFDFTIINSSDNGSGIKITGNDTKILYCDIKDNGYGIYFKNAYDSKKVCCNNLSNNNHYGIYLESSDYNMIYFNLFENNNQDTGFINSGGNVWDNKYSKNIDKKFQIIKGKASLGRFSFRKIDIDYCNYMWYTAKIKIKTRYYSKLILTSLKNIIS
jgi:parallel beta-helix repeat protein